MDHGLFLKLIGARDWPEIPGIVTFSIYFLGLAFWDEG
jgi:hypothetical protein